MKAIISSLVAIFFFANITAQSNAFVHVKNNQLTDSAGKTIFLEGVNLGGWLLWEEWIWGGGLNGETRMKERLQSLLGNEGYENFLNQYYHNFITEKDIALIAGNGFNSIRLPFNYRLFEKDDGPGYALVDSLLNWCKKYGLYVILDMHAAPGGQSPYFIADPSGTLLWNSEENRRLAINIWKKIAARYRNEKTVAGYDLLNEPKAADEATLPGYYNELQQQLRAVDPNHLLIEEGNNLAHEFKSFPAIPDSNIIYSFHYYSWFAENNKQKDIEKMLKQVKSAGPLWCGEWGEDNTGNLLDNRLIIKQQPRICGMSFWTWKKVYKKDNRFPLLSIQPNTNWDKVINWITWKIFKPGKEEVKRGIDEFLRAIQADRCHFNTQVKEVVLR